MKTAILNSSRTLVIAMASLGLFTAATTATAVAQNLQGSEPSANASSIFNAQSGFQGNGFQQGGTGSAAVTAGGSASALHQVNPGPLTVTGASANQTVTKTNNNSSLKLWSSIIFFVSAIGLLLTYIYTKRTNKKQAAAAEDFAETVIATTKTKAKSTKNSDADTTVTSTKKGKPKKKKKNKKHHR